MRNYCQKAHIYRFNDADIEETSFSVSLTALFYFNINEEKLWNYSKEKNTLFYGTTDLIKVITGVRRCGKSSLMQMIKEELKTSSIKDE